MICLELNNGKTINLIHTTRIFQDGKTVNYEYSHSGLSNEVEQFDTEDEATTRFNKVKDSVVMK